MEFDSSFPPLNAPSPKKTHVKISSMVLHPQEDYRPLLVTPQGIKEANKNLAKPLAFFLFQVLVIDSSNNELHSQTAP